MILRVTQNKHVPSFATFCSVTWANMGKQLYLCSSMAYSHIQVAYSIGCNIHVFACEASRTGQAPHPEIYQANCTCKCAHILCFQATYVGSITLICLEHALISLILAMQAGVRPSFNYTCTALVMYTGPLWSPL